MTDQRNYNYSVEELDWALDHLLPSIAQAKALGETFSKPELIKQVAWLELVGEYSSNKPDTHENYPRYPHAKYIVGLAAHDLHTYGYFKY